MGIRSARGLLAKEVTRELLSTPPRSSTPSRPELPLSTEGGSMTDIVDSTMPFLENFNVYDSFLLPRWAQDRGSSLLFQASVALVLDEPLRTTGEEGP
ncbi:hypothetical protein J1614_000330 [Plenodomus biglobosus]|nr:hypothetical protein J1614_000330 [Plenodomus biglobosus]